MANAEKKDAPVKEENPDKGETSPEKTVVVKEAPKEVTKYDGGAILK
jgi:hypothetical protein